MALPSSLLPTAIIRGGAVWPSEVETRHTAASAHDTPKYARQATSTIRGVDHVLDVYLVDGRPVDLRLDGESLFPVWFKLEFKEDGQVSAKVKGVRLATRFGDAINIHQGRP